MSRETDQSQHRSKIDIIESILNFLYEKGSVKKTHLLYATNLNTRSLEKYLNHLVEINAVKTKKDRKGRLKYILTPYGRHLLRLIIKLHYILDHVGSSEILKREINKKICLEREDETCPSILINDIQGRSGLIYNVTVANNEKERYILIYFNDPHINDNDLVDEISRILLYLIDTNEKIIIVLKNLGSYRRELVKRIILKIMKYMENTKKRCLFIE